MLNLKDLKEKEKINNKVILCDTNFYTIMF